MMEEEEDVALLEQMMLEAEAEDKEKSNTSEVKKKESSEKDGSKNFLYDSSDEEDSRSLLSRYNDYGHKINQKLKESDEIRKYNSIRLTTNETPGTSSSFIGNLPQSVTTSKIIPNDQPKETVFCDPVFGLRIINPLISSSMLRERMAGKTAVGVQRVKFHTERGDRSQDWVIAGVIVGKSPVRETQKGDQFSILSISDLRGEIKTFNLFLFRTAHKELWKTSIGFVIAVLNPKILERRDDKVQAALSIDNHQKVMVLGQSKDLGYCKSKKNNGEPCAAIINKTDCDVCIFHMKKEYSKFKRSELQSSSLGRGLEDLRNKVLGKSEVFYAGQSFMAQKAKKPVKQMLKDRDRLMSLSEYSSMPYNSEASSSSSTITINRSNQSLNNSINSSENTMLKRAASHDLNSAQRRKDLERLKMLQGTESPQIILTTKFRDEQNKIKALDNPSLQVPQASRDTNFVPKLSNENITFSFSMPSKSNEMAKRRAAEILKKKPLEVSNPNLVKYRGTDAGKKRIADTLNSSLESDAKKVKVSEVDEAKKRKEYLQRIMNAKSSHDDFVENIERDKQQKCLDSLEKKEALEEKMANTMELKVK